MYEDEIIEINDFEDHYEIICNDGKEFIEYDESIALKKFTELRQSGLCPILRKITTYVFNTKKKVN